MSPSASDAALFNAKICNAVVGLILTFGGFMGYQNGSFMSLLAGSGSGMALLGIAGLIHAGKPKAVVASALLSAVLAVVMFLRFVATQSPIPGVITLLCIIAFFMDGMYLKGSKGIKTH